MESSTAQLQIHRKYEVGKRYQLKTISFLFSAFFFSGYIVRSTICKYARVELGFSFVFL